MMQRLSNNNFLRRTIWRVGRKLYCIARGDIPNNPSTNGEYWLLDEIIRAADQRMVMLDVGANKGDWTLRAMGAANQCGKALSVVAFEPCSGTREILGDRVAKFESVQISACALSSSEGEAEFFSSTAGAGTNSLSDVSGQHSEKVVLTTLDAFLAKAAIPHLSMLKIDTEGFDFSVLQGANQTLAAGRVDVVQFEYNWRWLINHASLRDVFQFLKDKPYVLGKLTGTSIDFYDEWHFEMDRYFENNYVLVRKDHAMIKLGVPVRFDASNCAQRTHG